MKYLWKLTIESDKPNVTKSGCNNNTKSSRYSSENEFTFAKHTSSSISLFSLVQSSYWNPGNLRIFTIIKYTIFGYIEIM